MKTIFSILLSLCCFQFASGQVVKTIYKTFSDLEKISALNLKFDCEIEVEEWTESRILVETKVSMANSNKNILAALVEAGRYDLVVSEGSTLGLDFKKINNTITYKGIKAPETITVKVYVPKVITVSQNPSGINAPRPEYAADIPDESSEGEGEYYEGYEDYNQDSEYNWDDYVEPANDYPDDYDWGEYGPPASDGSDQVTPPE